MPSLKCNFTLITSALAATALLLGTGVASAQSVGLTAASTNASLPDGTTVPMWGYTCGTASGTGVSCAPLNPNAGTQWSPVVITVPAGTATFTISLTNNLPAGVPTSLTIVGQLGGGLGSGGTSTPSPNHTNAQSVTWPIAGSGPGAPPSGAATPPAQGMRVQSFGTEVLASGATPQTNQCASPCTLSWNNLKPGTYLLESGTHPSIQGPMGLYGILVVTAAPASNTSAGCAYPDPTSTSGACSSPAVQYNAELPLLFSEIDPVQNNAVFAATATPGFLETNVWAGLSAPTTTTPSAVLCRLVSGEPAANGTCYPPAVNYTPLYYLINGVGFDKTHSANSLFAATPGTSAAPVSSGTVLLRLVNAGLRMHVPSIVGPLTTGVDATGAPTTVAGFTLLAEDGNPLPPARPRVQSEVFLPAGKTYDVSINVPTCTPVSPATTCTPSALPIFDRELSLSANATARDAGMLAYIGVNGAALATGGAFAAAAAAAANPDSYFLVAGQTLVISDPAKGVIANDVNVNQVQLTGGTVACTSPISATPCVVLNSNGTFSFVPGAATSGNFNYCVNGAAAGTTSLCTTVTLNACDASSGCQEAASGIAMGTAMYTAKGTFLRIQPPGILSFDKDAAGLALSVVLSSVAGLPACPNPLPNPVTTACVTVDPNGGFFAAAPPAGGSFSFTYSAQNSQKTQSTSTATVQVTFPAASNLSVTVIDGKDRLNGTVNANSTISDYRWVIEEDRTFYVNPNCTSNPPPAGCPGANTAGLNVTGIVPTFGANFHTSHMPVVATGCTGILSCEGGQSIYDPGTGKHINAVCDQGNGVCRPDITGNGFTPTFPSQVHLDPTKRYYLSVLPGDAANPFENTNLSPDCTNGQAAATNPGQCGHGMGGAPVVATCSPFPCTPTTFASVTVLTEPAPYPPAKLSVFVFEDDFPLNGEHDGGGGVDVLSPNEPGLGGFNITIFDDAGGTGDATGQVTYDMFNQPLSNSLAGTIDPATGLDACPVSKVSRIGPKLDSNGNPVVVNGKVVLDPTQGGITGTIVTCPKYESDGKTLSPLAGQAVVANLFAGRYGVVATAGADAIARGEEWLQTNTLDGQKAHDSFLRIGEPSFFQEFGPAGYHVSIGFANPGIINARLNALCNGSDPNSPQPGVAYKCNNTVTGQVTTERMSRTPDERLYSSGDYSSFAFTQCYVSIGDPDGEDFAFTKCNADGTFTLAGLPQGDWRVTVFDQWNDMLVDGLSTPVLLGGGNTTKLGQIATNQWQTNIYTTTFFDTNYNGVRDSTESGLALVATNNRFRDGSFSNFNNTDLNGYAGFNEIFPLFSWYVIETDSTRYKNTGTHVVYDAGGPADNTPCGNAITTNGQPAPTAPCGKSNIASHYANTVETVPLPTSLRVPGAVYCTTADCSGSGESISNGPFVPGGSSGLAPGSCTINPSNGQTICSGNTMSTGRIDPPWVVSEGWQGFSGENEFVEFGKKPYASGENGGIRGHVVYASTRPFDDPQLLLQTSWEPLVPNVTINLYQLGTGPDGITQSLKLVDTTTTSSWDDWAQGFYATPVTDASNNQIQKPYMNCPGQLGAPASGAAGDLFYFTLYNQPNWLDVYANGGTPANTIPYNSQFKCYDGMHNWNQVQPAPYDGMYQFPSITGIDPVTGRPTGTSCSICVTNPDSTDPYRYGGSATPVKWTPGHGTPMLPAGQYVVEVVVPPGFELVKEEDKNILIGDNYIAPATVQFPGLGSAIYILPDQASIAAAYNANQGGLAAYNGTNVQNPTQSLGRIASLPSHEGDTGSVETFPPCVGQTRIVPDYISLFPQSHEVAPFAGAVRNLCDRKLVQLDDQTQALAKFYVFTSTHVAAHFTGVITDDFTSEFDPFSPQFGEKFSPANLPVALKDWTGQEVSRVYSDQWGTYNGLTYSTWEVNPPNPTGYAPTMMVTCMNDPGSGTTPDPLFNPAYSQFCYEIPFMPAQTQYMDTPVVPTSAFAGAGYNNPDCDYPDSTPGISEVDVDANLGPWADTPSVTHTLHIYALGTLAVNNYAYSGPAATIAPFNQTTLPRKYSFGGNLGTVVLVSAPDPVSGLTTTQPLTVAQSDWTDSHITATVPALSSAFTCPVQQQSQYGGPVTSGTGPAPAVCGQLVITNSSGRQSVDTVTITIGGKMPIHVAASASLQKAIDAAMPGDMLIIDPATRATPTTPAGAAVHNELLLMWKPIRLQGVGAVSSVINANTHPAGRIDIWRRQVDCLFGLSLDGYQSLPGGTPFTTYDTSQTYSCGTTADFGAGPTTLFGFQPTATNPQVDRLPLEAVIGWNASLNGNLAELLQEPSLMGALEGAAITVLSKGVYIPDGSTDVFGGNAATAGSYPTGTVLTNGLTSDSTKGCGPNTPTAQNPFPSNFLCNPSSIDSLTIENSSQGGGGIFVHGWGHNIQIANNRVLNNSGTLSGGINIGQGEFPGAYTIGGTNADPGSCQTSGYAPNTGLAGKQLPYCFDRNVNLHHNMVSKNSSTGDELFSATPAGAGGVSICNGSDYYRFNYNWVCGNLSTGDGGGIAHIGYSYNGDIEHNSILFNQSTNPTIATNGGGLLIMGAPDADPTCGANTDLDCLPTPVLAPGDGAGPGLVINANLIQSNGAESGSGGGLRFQNVNGTDVLTFPRSPTQWYGVSVTNNIITNNVAGWDGAGISLFDALNVNIINNTIMSNDTTASSGVLFNTLGAPLASSQGPCPVARSVDGTCPVALTQSRPQPAGLVAVQNSSQLASAMAALPSTLGVRWSCPSGHYSSASANNGNCGQFSYPELYNNLLWQNRSFSIGVGSLGIGPINQQNVVTLRPTLTQPTADATTANGTGGGVVVTGGTGACVPEPTPFNSAIGGYWDIGVRGDPSPSAAGTSGTAVAGGSGTVANPRLAPTYSVITDFTDYSGTSLHNSGSNPTVLRQYCNGARVPPENGGLGYNVPPGIADATVPNPIFSLTPAATVDEGNNWINIAWGPLSLVNTSTGSQNGITLGNYGLAALSPAINFVPATGSGSTYYNAAPPTDFYGNARKNGFVDAGAVEFGATAPAAVLAVAPTSLAFGSVATGTTSATQNLTLRNTGNATATAIAAAISAPFTRVTTGTFPGTAPNCGTTLAAGANCTIKVALAPTATGAFTGTATITANVAVSGSPVSLTGSGVPAVLSAGLTPVSWTVSATRGCTTGFAGIGGTCPTQVFTLTNTGNVPLTGITQGVLGGANASEFSITRLLSTCGPAGGGQLAGLTTLAPGATCVVRVRFSPLTSQTTGIKNATVSVTDAAGTQTSTLTGTAN